MEKLKSNLSYVHQLMLACIGAAVMYDFLILREFGSKGIAYTAMVFILLGGFSWAYKNSGGFFTKDKTIFLGFVVLSALIPSVRGSYWYVEFSKFITIVALLVYCLYITNKKMGLGRLLESVFAPIGYIHKLIFEIYKVLIVKFDKKEKNKNDRENLKKILVGLILSLPILIVVLSLLAGSDAVFGEILKQIGTLEIDILDEDIVARIFIGIIISSYIFAFNYRYFLKEEKELIPSKEEKKEDDIIIDLRLDKVIVSTILVVLNLVYAFFVIVQFKYLFSGEISTILKNMTYSEYARRGFFELVIVAIINIAIISGVRIYTKEDSKFIKIMNLCMIAFSYVMMYSAYFRMNLYEDRYGYTHKRFFVYIIIAYLVIIFSICAYSLIKERKNVFKTYIYIAAVFYIAIGMFNVDGFIAKKNIDRYIEVGKIDYKYVERLSVDALSQQKRLLKAQHAHIRIEMKNHVEEVESELKVMNWRKHSLSTLIKSLNVKWINKRVAKQLEKELFKIVFLKLKF